MVGITDFDVRQFLWGIFFYICIQYPFYQWKEFQFFENRIQNFYIDMFLLKIFGSDIGRNFGTNSDQGTWQMDGWLAIEQILPLFAFEFIDMGIYSVDISIFIDQGSSAFRADSGTSRNIVRRISHQS